MGSSRETVLALVASARRRLRAAALADALAGPAAGFLLVASAALAASRATGRADLPEGTLAAAGILAALVVLARLAHRYPGTGEAALHLDRALAAQERFTTVLETADRDPALAEWAARGALARARGEGLRAALALRPPPALLPLALAGTLAAGLALLPAPPAAASGGMPGEGGPEVAVPARGAGPGGKAARPGATPRTGAAVASAASAAPREDPLPAALRALEERARRDAVESALRDLAEARAALERGDRAAAEAAARRAAAALGAGSEAVPSSAGAPGATGGGEVAAGESSPGDGPAPLRQFPVPLRAREAVRRYFQSGGPK
jgi:hypothetical protein